MGTYCTRAPRRAMHKFLASLLLITVNVFGQSPSASTITIVVTDENGVAVRSARVSARAGGSAISQCETDYAGRCQLSSLAAGTYQLQVEKEGFYAAHLPASAMAATLKLDVSLHHQLEVRERLDVKESAPAIDPAQVSSQQTLSGVDIINMPFPETHDYRNVLNFIPGVVNDSSLQPHISGGETYQTLTLLDGFNITQPANGELLARISTDAFRSITVEPARESAEYGKGSAGVLRMETGSGDDHFRFSATNFVPSFQENHGLRFDQFVPRFTVSGPIRKHKIWFYDAIDGEADNIFLPELPSGENSSYFWRVGNLAKVQTNLASNNILATSFVVNYLQDQHAFFSPQNPLSTTPKDVETGYIAGIKDQHYFSGGTLLETGFGYTGYNLQLTPYGNSPYFLNPETAGGNYYLNAETHARRYQGLANLNLPSQQWHGRHDVKMGVDLQHISYDTALNRQAISFLSSGNVLPLSSGDTCLTAQRTPDFPCTRYTTFTAASLHQQPNDEFSAYVQDRWLVTDRLLLEPGVRFDWDRVIGAPLFSPRLAGTYVLNNSGNTKLSAGVGVIYDETPLFLIERPYEGTRQDTFFTINPDCATNPACSPAVITNGPVTTTFTANTDKLSAPRFVNWSFALEQKLPAAIYMKAEFLERRGSHGFVYDTSNDTSSGDYILQNTRSDHYDALQISLRRTFHENYNIMGAYTRSRAHSNQVLDFSVDNSIESPQLPGPYPWDTPNRFLSWGYLPFFKLPLIHKTEIAYSMEARTGFPFYIVNDQQQLAEMPGSRRYPEYFSLNVQFEKRFHLFGYYWALRGGCGNITGHRNPMFVNNNIDSPQFMTFGGFDHRTFTSRIRLIGRK